MWSENLEVMAHDVFISYSRADSEVANAVCKAFDANGISYWIDKEGVISGESFAKRIVPAIKNSKITVFLSSQNSNMSVFTVKEIVIAFNNGKHIIPFRIENIGFSDQLEFFLCDLSWINAFENLQSNIQQLVASIKKLLGINEPTLNKKGEKDISQFSNKDGSTSRHNAFANFIETVNGVPFEMVAVEGGTFTMGSPLNELGRDSNEKQHKVKLSNFYIGKTVVTQALWKAVIGHNPSNFIGDNLPVEQVSFNYCQEFIKNINKLTGKMYKMPTESQWEFAARGGNNSKGNIYAGSNNLDKVGWFYENSGDKQVSNASWFTKIRNPNNNRTHPVGQKYPNELGLLDMSGNVEEWCQDWYDEYNDTLKLNPTGRDFGSYRVTRGGFWRSSAQDCRVACRSRSNPNEGSFVIGFRLALSLI